MKFLVIQTAFIGDVILATPIIEQLKISFPESKIDFLLQKGNESLLANNPHLNEILILDKKKNKYFNVYKLIKQIRKTEYDWVINLQRFATTGLITALSNAANSVGFDKNPFSFLYTEKVSHIIGNQNYIGHEVNRNLSLLQCITNENANQSPRLYPSKENYKVVPQDKEYITIAPSSIWYTKQFPKHKWIELIDKMPSTYTIYLLGAKSDFILCEDIKNKCKEHSRIQNFAGKLSFLDSAALMSKAKMNFVNDSAPMHIASAMNAPVTAIYCSTIPEFGFTPLSDHSIVIQTSEKLECRPCGLHGKKECPLHSFKCADIEIDTILNRAFPEEWV